MEAHVSLSCTFLSSTLVPAKQGARLLLVFLDVFRDNIPRSSACQEQVLASLGYR